MSATTTPGSKRRRLSCRAAVATLGIIALPFAVSASAAIPASARVTSFGSDAPAPAAPALAPAAPASISQSDPGACVTVGLAAPLAASALAPADPATVDGTRAGHAAAAEAFFAAGYSFTDAEALASAWGLADAYAAKVKAGGYLAAGVALTGTPYATRGAAEGVPDETLTTLFSGLGYGPADADTLAAQWGVSVADVEVKAGRELKITGVLPWVDPAVSDDAPALDAFFEAGYSYHDAEYLAAAWGVGDAYAAKVKAGGYLADGVSLSRTPYADRSADDGYSSQQLREVFSAFGYTAADAQTLATQWNVGVPRAQLRAGRLLKVVGVLPYVDVAVNDDAPYLDAFFAAGCNYDDALTLADFWGLGEDTYAAKV